MDKLTHLKALEAESIHIMREVAAEFDNPVMLYSVGKDSSVLLHLARKAFYPGKIPFPLMHVDTNWKFKEMIQFRDKMAEKIGFDAYGVSEEMPDPVARSIRSILDHMHAVDERMEAMCKTLQSLDSGYQNNVVPPLNEDDFKGVRDEQA